MKGRKLLAGVLSAAMLLSTAALPAFAEDSSTEMTYGDFLQKMFEKKQMNSLLSEGGTADASRLWNRLPERIERFASNR